MNPIAFQWLSVTISTKKISVAVEYQMRCQRGQLLAFQTGKRRTADAIERIENTTPTTRPLIKIALGKSAKSIRGFETKSIGPKDIYNNPVGGNKKLFFSSELGQLVLQSLYSSSVIPHINKSDLTNVFIPIPPLDEQRLIVDTGSELNRLTKREYLDQYGTQFNYYYDSEHTCSSPYSRGRLVEISEPSGKTCFEYDQKGRVVSRTKCIDNQCKT